ncbi:MAG: hypothetical protein WBB36_15635 [Chitinophagales bacterium]
MKNSIILCFLLLFLTTIIRAQQSVNKSVLKLSAEMKEPSNATIDDYLGEDENSFYVLRKKVNGYSTSFFGTSVGFIIESYGHDLLMKKRQEFEPGINGMVAEMDMVKYIDGKLFAYISYVNRKEEKTELYYQVIDKKTLQLTGTPVKIAAIPYNSRSKQGEFRYQLSVNRKSIAIISALRDEKQTKETFTTKVYDSNMKEVWSKNITLPYESELFEREKLLLDNNGNIYLSGRLYNEKLKEKRNGMANYSYKILAFRDSGKVAKEYDIVVANQFITDVGFNITNDDKLAVAGFYSAQGTYSIKGISFTLINAASGSVIKQGVKPFDATFLELFSKSQVDKKDEEIYNYDLDNIIIRSDGGVLLLAEQYFVESRSTRYYTGSSYTTRTTYYYNYNDVMAININPDLSVAWATKIAKRQVTTDDGGYYSSYAYAVGGDKIYLLFNDNPDNLLVTDPSKLAKYSGVKRSVATLVTISSDGKWKKSLLFSNQDQGEILRPKVCKQVSDHQFFLYAEKGKNYVLGKADL